MSEKMNPPDAADALEAIASKWVEIDQSIAGIWMQLPDSVKSRLNDIGFGTKLDALQMAQKIQAIANSIQDAEGVSAGARN